jgi:hypothetical protein
MNGFTNCDNSFPTRSTGLVLIAAVVFYVLEDKGNLKQQSLYERLLLATY